MNESIYPKDWFCSLCKRTFSKHAYIGERLPTVYKNEDIATAHWCFKGPEVPMPEQWRWRFQPADNLTQIELLAQLKRV